MTQPLSGIDLVRQRLLWCLKCKPGEEFARSRGRGDAVASKALVVRAATAVTLRETTYRPSLKFTSGAGRSVETPAIKVMKRIAELRSAGASELLTHHAPRSAAAAGNLATPPA